MFDINKDFAHDLKLCLVWKKTSTPLNLDGLIPSMFLVDRLNELLTVSSPNLLISINSNITLHALAASTFEKAVLSPTFSSFSFLEDPIDENF